MERFLIYLVLFVSIFILPLKLKGSDRDSTATLLCEKLALNVRTPLKSRTEYAVHKNSTCSNLTKTSLNQSHFYFYFTDGSNDDKCAFLKSRSYSKATLKSKFNHYYEMNEKFLETGEGFKVICEKATLYKEEGLNPVLRAPGLTCAGQPYGGWNCVETLLDPEMIY